MTRKIDKENTTGLTREKKEILKSLEGVVQSPLDMNAMMEEIEQSCKEVRQVREGKKPTKENE